VGLYDWRKRDLKDYDTPGKPQVTLSKHEGEPVEQSEYRSIVGVTLFAVRKAIPDCANVIRDLSGHLNNPGKEHWDAVERLLGYLKHHYKPLKIRTPKALDIVGYSDSDWASDKNDRKSICSSITTIGGATVHWQSKKQDGVALSSTEAELIAASLAATNIKFQRILLSEIVGNSLKSPSTLYVDNNGAVHIARNGAVGPRTKHVDVRDRFVTHMTTKGELVVEHIRTENNPSDILSKNCREKTHTKHAESVYDGSYPVTYREDVAEYSIGDSKMAGLACARTAFHETRDSDWITVTSKRPIKKVTWKDQEKTLRPKGGWKTSKGDIYDQDHKWKGSSDRGVKKDHDQDDYDWCQRVT
jgi:hypothetical protein